MSSVALFARLDNQGNSGFTQDYLWVKEVKPILSQTVVSATQTITEITGYDIVMASIDEFLAARENDTKGEPFDWPDFKQRLQEMNHKNAGGSRSGDIIAIFDGRQGYLSINHEHEVYPGWHGGPTKSESDVPLFVSMPGRSFVDASGNNTFVPAPLAAGVTNTYTQLIQQRGKYLRNWDMGAMISNIYKEINKTEQ